MIPIEVTRSVRAERLLSIRAGRPIVSLIDGAMVVLHCIPVRRDPQMINIAVGSVTADALLPLGCRFPDRLVFDFEGVLSTVPGPAGKVRGYAELRRNGIIEAVDTALLHATASFPGAPRFLPSTPLAGAIIVATQRFLRLQSTLGIQPPIAIGLSLLGAQGYYLALDDRLRTVSEHELLHQELVFPGVIARTTDDDPTTLLRSTFDQLWNAAGLASCRDYDDPNTLANARKEFES